MSAQRILIFEDDEDLAFLLVRTLRNEGYHAEHRLHGRHFREAIDAVLPDLVLLDVMLPASDGYSICRQIKSQQSPNEIKVIMLTAKSEQEDVLQGFNCGADDYVTKPFSPREIVARVKTVLRRQQLPLAGPKKESVRQKSLLIDDERHQAELGGQPLNLTVSEYKLLRQMAAHPKRIYSRHQLSDTLSDSAYASEERRTQRNIDVHIRSLRKKLGPQAAWIKTMRGVGYYFEADDE